MVTIEQILQQHRSTTAQDWHQHPNGEGWVQNTAHVHETAYVGCDAHAQALARKEAKRTLEDTFIECFEKTAEGVYLHTLKEVKE